jgi:hypothetical protein
MLVDVVAVRALGGHRLWLEFEGGVAGELDFERVLSFEGVLAPLRDPECSRVRVDPEWGTLAWPGDVDIDSDVLHALVEGRSLPEA